MGIIIDEQTLKAFEKEDICHDTAFAFSHLFAFLQGKTKLESPFKEKFEEIGLVNPESELMMENIESDLEWILLTQVYDGMLERKWDAKDKAYRYKNSPKGEQEAIRLIRELSKKCK